MNIEKLSEYILKDDKGSEIRLKYTDDSWHLIVNEYSVFTFNVEEARKLANLLLEINRSSHVFLQVLKDLDKAASNSAKDEIPKHIIPPDIY